MGAKKIAIAGPGTGKTTFLVNEAVDALSADDCYGIIISTYTRKAAKELTEKIREKVLNNESAQSKNILTGTIHSVCYQLLNLYTDAPARSIIDETKLINFIFARIDALGFNAQEYNKPLIEIASDMETIFGWLTDLEADVDAFNLDDPYIDDIITAYSRYKRMLKRNRLYDFATIQEKTLDQLENNSEFQEMIHANYNYFFIDEFQDVNNIQNKIFKCLGSGDNNLCVVGDDDQSIYGFRGADRSQIINFENTYEEVERIELFNNYRSTKNIVEASNYLINLSHQERLDKKIVSHRSSPDFTGCEVSLNSFESDTDEYEFIAEQINALVEKYDFNFSDIAILMISVKRNNEIIQKVLNKYSIPYEFSALGGLLWTIYGSEFLALLALYIDIKNDESKDIFLKEMSDLEEELYEFHIENNTTEKINQLRGFNSCTDLIYKLLETTDFIYRYERHGENIGKLTELATSFDEYSSNYDEYRFHSYLRFLKKRKRLDESHLASDSVQVMTIHQSKGLEFPVVFLSDMNKYRIPTSKTDLTRVHLTGEELNEERNKIYVAMTRAEEKLFITESRKKYGRRKNFESNRFFKELCEEFNSPKNHLDTQELLQRRNQHAGSEIYELLLSYSNLKTFWICPKRYQFQNIYRLKTLQLGGLFFGNNVHRIIEHILRKIKLDNFDATQLEDIILENWIDNPVENASKNRNQRNTATEQIEGFILNFCNGINPEQIEAVEKPFEVSISQNVKLTGRYDAILRFDDDPTIIDFKTGDISEEDIRKQLSMYKLVYEKENNELANTAVYSLKQNQQLSTETEDKDSFLKELLSVSKRIINKDFDATPGKCCQDCPYRRLCKDSV